MTLELAQRMSELLLAVAFLQSSCEHILSAASERRLFVPRAVFSLALFVDQLAPAALLLLSAHSFFVLHRFGGPYNGGSDRMALLILYCLTAAAWLPDGRMTELAFGYLGLQLVLSYVISGQVKLTNPDWRSGRALSDVFRFSAYPVSMEMRGLAQWPRLLFTLSWAVMVFEIAFPAALLNTSFLYFGLMLGLAFHLVNAILFGLNRFVWSWLAAYPSLIWLQTRVEQLL
ncbi:MAG: HTTM domain-containing protein [Pseudomonadota bacterium]